MPREFVYDGRSFGDPNPKLSVEEMRQYLANFLTELSNATSTETKKPGKDGGEETTVITFTRRVGTKGMATQEAQVIEYRITYKPGEEEAILDGKNPGLIAVIRNGRLNEFVDLDFPPTADTVRDGVRGKFIEFAIMNDWEGWLAFMREINHRLNLPPFDFNKVGGP